jgi:hypothetical protein
MTILLSNLLNWDTAKGRPVREITDPAYRITSGDDGWLLKWRGATQATWTLANDALRDTDVLTYRASDGALIFDAEVPGSMSCGFPGHNAVGMVQGFVQLLVDTNNTGDQAAWVLAGATGIETGP